MKIPARLNSKELPRETESLKKYTHLFCPSRTNNQRNIYTDTLVQSGANGQANYLFYSMNNIYFIKKKQFTTAPHIQTIHALSLSIFRIPIGGRVQVFI